MNNVSLGSCSKMAMLLVAATYSVAVSLLTDLCQASSKSAMPTGDLVMQTWAWLKHICVKFQRTHVMNEMPGLP